MKIAFRGNHQIIFLQITKHCGATTTASTQILVNNRDDRRSSHKLNEFIINAIRDDKTPSDCSSGPNLSAAGETFSLLGSEVFMHACAPLERIRLLKGNGMINTPLDIPVNCAA